MDALWVSLAGFPVGVMIDEFASRLATPPTDSNADRSDVSAERIGRGVRHRWIWRTLITGVTVALFMTAGIRFDGARYLMLVLACVAVLVLCAATDVESFRIPNVVTYPAIIAAAIVGTTSDASTANVVLGGVVAGGLLLLPALLTGGIGLGVGDAKLAAFVGLALGLRNAIPALLITALLGGTVAACLLLARVRRRNEPIPYAPFISAGALAVLLWRGPAFVHPG